MSCIQVIVSDKTGTLTSNKLTVAHVWVDNQIGEIDTSAEQSPGVSFDTGSHSWKNMARVAVLCNASQFKVIKSLCVSTDQTGHRPSNGDLCVPAFSVYCVPRNFVDTFRRQEPFYEVAEPHR